MRFIDEAKKNHWSFIQLSIVSTNVCFAFGQYLNERLVEFPLKGFVIGAIICPSISLFVWIIFRKNFLKIIEEIKKTDLEIKSFSSKSEFESSIESEIILNIAENDQVRKVFDELNSLNTDQKKIFLNKIKSELKFK